MERFQDQGERLRRFLEKINISQSDFARLMGVTPGAVNHWLSGRADFGATFPRRLAELLEWPLSTVSYELGLTGPEKPRTAYELLQELESQGKPLPRALVNDKRARPWGDKGRRHGENGDSDGPGEPITVAYPTGDWAHVLSAAGAR